MFKISESTAYNIFNYWQQILAENLPSSLLEQVKKCQENEEEVREELTEYELVVDSCEQEIERPKDYEEQKKYYSGKKKQHTFKTQFVVLPKGQEIVDVVTGQPGLGTWYKIIQERFRLNKKRYNSILSTICGLVRLRLGSLILEVIKSPETGETIDVIMAHLFSTKMDLDGAKAD